MPRDQIVLFPQTLEERIPADHPVRLLDEILGRIDWSLWEAEYHGSLGQPPIHPSLLARVLLFAMLRRLRSSRVIEYEIKHSVDFIWLVSGRTIDHVMGVRQFLLRGQEGVQTEWLWGTMAFNLKKLMSLIGPLRADSSWQLETASS